MTNKKNKLYLLIPTIDIFYKLGSLWLYAKKKSDINPISFQLIICNIHNII